MVGNEDEGALRRYVMVVNDAGIWLGARDRGIGVAAHVPALT